MKVPLGVDGRPIVGRSPENMKFPMTFFFDTEEGCKAAKLFFLGDRRARPDVEKLKECMGLYEKEHPGETQATLMVDDLEEEDFGPEG